SPNVSITNSSFIGNTAAQGSGGGVGVSSSSLSIENTTFSSNTAVWWSGAIHADANTTLQIAGSRFVGNSGMRGGAIRIVEGSLTVDNSELYGNYASSYGGAIFNDPDATVQIVGSQIVGNSGDTGGAVCNDRGALTVVNSAFYGNRTSGSGSAVYSSGSATIINSTIAGNSAYNHNSAVFSEGQNEFRIYNSIIAENYAWGFASNWYGPNLVESSNNILGGDPGFVVAPVFDANGNLLNLNATDSLDALDLRLTATSPAVESGSNEIAQNYNITVDLDGNARVAGTNVDIGAYEYQEEIPHRETPSITVTTADDVLDATDDLISLREAINYAGTNGLGTTIDFAPSLQGATLTISEGFAPDKDVVIDASRLKNEDGTPGITINANHKCDFFTTNLGLSLTGIAFQNGKTAWFGPFYVTGGFNASYCVFSDNESGYYGGVLYSERCDVTIDHCLFENNTAVQEGGALRILDSPNVSITNSSFTGNTAKEVGALRILNSPNVSITNSSFIGNTAAQGSGGGVGVSSSSLSIENTTFSSNTAVWW
ncbi:MAG: hypothetical protein J6X44_08555, partial [Thermoguttaceae bacterium]|nr:hypothetical protein [Thermoguttaceae bacterium]